MLEERETHVRLIMEARATDADGHECFLSRVHNQILVNAPELLQSAKIDLFEDRIALVRSEGTQQVHRMELTSNGIIRSIGYLPIGATAPPRRFPWLDLSQPVFDFMKQSCRILWALDYQKLSFEFRLTDLTGSIVEAIDNNGPYLAVANESRAWLDEIPFPSSRSAGESLPRTSDLLHWTRMIVDELIFRFRSPSGQFARVPSDRFSQFTSVWR